MNPQTPETTTLKTKSPEKRDNYVELKENLENSNKTEDIIVQKLITEIEKKYNIKKNKVTPDLDKQENKEIGEVDENQEKQTSRLTKEFTALEQSLGNTKLPKTVESPSDTAQAGQAEINNIGIKPSAVEKAIEVNQAGASTKSDK